MANSIVENMECQANLLARAWHFISLEHDMFQVKGINQRSTKINVVYFYDSWDVLENDTNIN